MFTCTFNSPPGGSDVIVPQVAPSTGDKGNPYYAAELNQAGELYTSHYSGTLTMLLTQIFV